MLDGRNETFADYYSDSSKYKDYFYLNNFEDILRSYGKMD